MNLGQLSVPPKARRPLLWQGIKGVRVGRKPIRFSGLHQPSTFAHLYGKNSNRRCNAAKEQSFPDRELRERAKRPTGGLFITPTTATTGPGIQASNFAGHVHRASKAFYAAAIVRLAPRKFQEGR